MIFEFFTNNSVFFQMQRLMLIVDYSVIFANIRYKHFVSFNHLFLSHCVFEGTCHNHCVHTHIHISSRQVSASFNFLNPYTNIL